MQVDILDSRCYQLVGNTIWRMVCLRSLRETWLQERKGSSKLGINGCKFSSAFRVPPRTSCQVSQHKLIVRNNYPQNADLPRYYSKKEKKPFPVPIVELRRAARERKKNSKGKPSRPCPPPRNGMLVRSLIPVAYEVLNARVALINNLKKLMRVVPVHACK